MLKLESKNSPFLVSLYIFVCKYKQAEAIKMHTDLNVGMYWGDMGVDYWGADVWKQEISSHEVGYFLVIMFLHLLNNVND